MPGLTGVDDALPGPPEEMMFDVEVFHTKQQPSRRRVDDETRRVTVPWTPRAHV
jgi:hypothetical protein